MQTACAFRLLLFQACANYGQQVVQTSLNLTDRSLHKLEKANLVSQGLKKFVPLADRSLHKLEKARDCSADLAWHVKLSLPTSWLCCKP